MKRVTDSPDIRKPWIKCVELAVEDDHLLRVLEPIRETILELQTDLPNIEATGDREWLRAFCDDEAEHIENLLGISFVICQTYTESVAQRVRRIHAGNERALKSREARIRQSARQLSGPLRNVPRDKEEMLKSGERLSPRSKMTKVEAIHAAANYFKHREAWPSDWRRRGTKGKSKRASSREMSRWTRDAIKRLGCKPHSTGNLRAVAKRLGNTDYAEMVVLETIVREWGRTLLANLRTRLHE